MYTREMMTIPEGEGQVCLHIWKPAGEVKALFQICHGMSEHLQRYDLFARFLNDHGFLVFGIDHPGHGLSEGIRGYFAHKHGWEYLTFCHVTANAKMQEQYPALPLILMGHSMGSFVARFMAAYYEECAKGYIFMGTAGPSPALRWGKILAQLGCLVGRKCKPSKLLHAMSIGSYAKAVPDRRTPYDWLSNRELTVESYIRDEGCGFTFTTGGFSALFSGLISINKRKWAKSLDKTKSYILISGDWDPVGDRGQGVAKVYQKMKRAGIENVTFKLYKGMRHEILNDDSFEEVCSDILAFAEGIL
ncbi:MAG TPA: alpha/beta hydrolase [Clostridiales bacterium]|mgnify:CR=1 FL=1|jgi:alpha-beta hydrolase superfamily lysophospholipase|nr:alpha/beta hydrolase [Clostridiales bacterium]HBE14580.1 alpha/beta hydrolase [Clostridiales bacterium]HCG35560.1 alpha/beta hydrolase [Clostridiales bacterium]